MVAVFLFYFVLATEEKKVFKTILEVAMFTETTCNIDWFTPRKEVVGESRSSKCYFTNTDGQNKITWSSSYQKCEEMNGNLLIIENLQEYEWIRQVLAVLVGDSEFSWYINAHSYIYNSKGTAWADGSLFNYTTILDHECEINSLASQDCGNESARCDCLEILQNGSFKRVFCDRDMNKGFICEMNAKNNMQLGNSFERKVIKFSPKCSKEIIDRDRWEQNELKINHTTYYYKFIEGSIAWNLAWHECRSEGSDLLWIENEDEFKWIGEKIRARKNLSPSSWWLNVRR